MQNPHPMRRLKPRSTIAAALAFTAMLAPAPASAFCDILGMIAEVERGVTTVSSPRPEAAALHHLDTLLAEIERRRRMLAASGIFQAAGGVGLESYLASRREFVALRWRDGDEEANWSGEAGEVRRLLAASVFPEACPAEVAAFRAAAPMAAAIAPSGALTLDLPDPDQEPKLYQPETAAPIEPESREEPLSGLASRLAALAARIGEDANAAILAALALAGLAAPLAVRATLKIRRRRDPRYLCYMPVEVKTETGEMATHIVDISKAGARIATRNLITDGDHVEITIQGVGHHASMVWTKPNFGGARFETRLTRREMKSILDRARRGAGVALQG